MRWKYKNRRNYKRGRSTNVVKMKFQSFMDISTNDQSMQIITISAGGKEILKRLAPQFGAYKYYRIGGVSVKLVPASTLPVDPTGLSYEAGENPTVDPRDQLTPGLMRITNGEDVFEDITGLSDDQQHGIYNNMLLDPRWFKWMLQSGTSRYATPRYWQIGQLHQDKWPGAIVNLPELTDDKSAVVGTNGLQQYFTSTGDVLKVQGFGGSSPYGLFQTGHKGVLGWLPTDGLDIVHDHFSNPPKEYPLLASPPEVEVMKIILPKAYKTRYYYRMFVTETVYFREPIVNFGVNGYRPLDVFHHVNVPYSSKPSTEVNPDAFSPDSYTGGNYGDD